MVSFAHKLADGLTRRGVQVAHDPDDPAVTAVLVIGGTRQLTGLWRARRRGVRLVQRLDGMNWLQRRRVAGVRPDLRHFLRAEVGNRLLALIRGRLADAVVYQSAFSRAWWERVWGPTPVPAAVILNGVDLTSYTPVGPERPPRDHLRLLLVEGSLSGGYEGGLTAAVGLAEGLQASQGAPVELQIVGRAPASLQAAWNRRAAVRLTWQGVVPRADIPALDRGAHLLYSADLHPACPNAVIEALACGLPVVAFDTGALRELVTPSAGRIVPYGGDAWRLDPPDVPGLVAAAGDALAAGETLRQGARARAEACFDLETMVDRYMRVLLGAGG
jgi:glycosyltransferase involved in cell wall biosynthesis